MGSDVPSKQLTGIDELLDHLLRRLLTTIGNSSNEEIKIELSALTDLIDTCKRNDELLEDLLDPTSLELQRKDLRALQKTQRREVARGRAELERLHIQSQQLLK